MPTSMPIGVRHTRRRENSSRGFAPRPRVTAANRALACPYARSSRAPKRPPGSELTKSWNEYALSAKARASQPAGTIRSMSARNACSRPQPRAIAPISDSGRGSLPWAGAQGNSTGLVGTPEQVADALLDYYDLGIDHFLIRGFDPLNDAIGYGRDLLPLVHELVAKRDATRAVAS